jgi:hypothetical protein
MPVYLADLTLLTPPWLTFAECKPPPVLLFWLRRLRIFLPVFGFFERSFIQLDFGRIWRRSEIGAYQTFIAQFEVLPE